VDLTGVGERAAGSAGIGGFLVRTPSIGALRQEVRSTEGVSMGRRKRRDKFFFSIYMRARASGGVTMLFDICAVQSDARHIAFPFFFTKKAILRVFFQIVKDALKCTCQSAYALFCEKKYSYLPQSKCIGVHQGKTYFNV
jgi:hypothetical protein